MLLPHTSTPVVLTSSLLGPNIPAKPALTCLPSGLLRQLDLGSSKALSQPWCSHWSLGLVAKAGTEARSGVTHCVCAA